LGKEKKERKESIPDSIFPVKVPICIAGHHIACAEKCVALPNDISKELFLGSGSICVPLESSVIINKTEHKSRLAYFTGDTATVRAADRLAGIIRIHFYK
jgi:hypothetical protein